MLVAGASDHMWKRQNKIYCHIFLPYNLFIFFNRSIVDLCVSFRYSAK